MRTNRLVAIVLSVLLFAGYQAARAATVDLVVNIVTDQPAYMSFDLEHITVTISNNGPDPATNVLLVVTHPLADIPFEASATCLALPGPNPNGPAVCPAGSGTAPSPAFTRVGQTLKVTLPVIPSQSQAQVKFDNLRCRSRRGSDGGQQESRCQGIPRGNYPLSATVSATESDALNPTNTATTNIFLYPPQIEYKVAITELSRHGQPGDRRGLRVRGAEHGDQPSDKLQLSATLQGQAGTMLPLTPTNNPNGANGSTLPNTLLQSIDCLSMALGSYPPGSVFPAVPAAWQACPTAGLIPIPSLRAHRIPRRPPAFPRQFPGEPAGLIDAPSAGGVMKFRAFVLVGDPVCVSPGDSGNRDLVFTFSASGFNETKLGATPLDNTVSVTTQVPGVCQIADIEFTTGGTPPIFALNCSGVGSWTHTATVTNLSSGMTAGTATNVPVRFEHHTFAFTETQGALTCTSVPAGRRPSPARLPPASSRARPAASASPRPSRRCRRWRR